MSGSGWGQSFKDYVESTGFGSAEYGRRVPLSGPSVGVLPWVALDRISVSFNDDVVVEADDLKVSGVNVASYPVASVRYDFDFRTWTGTATWTLARPVVNDRVVAEIEGDEGGVYGRTSAVRLDGDADYVPGGDLLIGLSIVAGDVDTSAGVNAFDLAGVKQTLTRGVTNLGEGTFSPYLITYDLTADGVINALDVAAVKRNLSRSLPPAPTSAAASLAVPSITTDLFASARVLA